MIEREIPKMGEIYRHFKGGKYEIDKIENRQGKTIVHYTSLYLVEGKHVSSERTLEKFFEMVDKTLPNGAKYCGTRFVLD